MGNGHKKSIFSKQFIQRIQLSVIKSFQVSVCDINIGMAQSLTNFGNGGIVFLQSGSESIAGSVRRKLMHKFINKSDVKTLRENEQEYNILTALF